MNKHQKKVLETSQHMRTFILCILLVAFSLSFFYLVVGEGPNTITKKPLQTKILAQTHDDFPLKVITYLTLDPQ